MRIVAALMLLAGCDVVFRLDHVGPPDAPPPCIATDNFAGTQIANTWVQFTGNPLFVIAQDETLRLDLSAAPSSAPGEALVRYDAEFDMTGGSVEVEVPKVLEAHPNTETYLRLRVTGDNSNAYEIRFGEGQLSFRTQMTGETTHRSRAYSLMQDRFWRITNGPDKDQVSFWTRGTTETDWFLETTQTARVPFLTMQMLLVVGTYNSGSSAPGFALYDNFAVCGARRL